MSAITKTIGDRVFSIGRMPPREALKLQVFLAQTMSEELGLLAKLRGAPTADQVDAACKALNSVAQKLDDGEKLLKMMDTAFEYVACNGKKVVLDSTFATTPGDMWKLFFACVEVNLGDFLAEIRSLLPQEETDGSQESSQRTSTGT